MKGTINEDNNYRAKIYFEQAQKAHYNKCGVYFDTWSKIAEIMELYAKEEIKRLKK